MRRREFLKGSVGLAGAALLGAAGERPAAALSARRRVSPAERVTIGVIGCGGMGNAHLDTLMRLRDQGLVDISAVCDVYSHRLQAAAAKTGAQAFSDYRRILDIPGINAVAIATPDHWHAKITVEAADAGKDVYCEKPMTYWKDLKAPQDVVKAIARNKRVMQVGTQGMSDSIWEQCAERIQAGALGKLVHAQASDCRNGPIGLYSPLSKDPNAVPGKTLDWDTWLGPAPKHAYEPGRFMAFRSYWDYSGGTGTDFFPHILTPLVRTMGLGFPKRATATGGNYYWEDGREVPDIFTLTLEYPKGPSILLLASLATETGLPMLIRGQQATLTFDGPGAIIEPQPSAGTGRSREEIARQRGASHDEHYKDFIRCIRTREKPRSNEVLGYQVMVALHMGIHAYRSGRAMEFDPATERARLV